MTGAARVRQLSRRATWWCGCPSSPCCPHAAPLTPLTPLIALCAAQGLLLDCDAGTLTVWVNGERKGVMVRPGMTDSRGERVVGRLEGPLRWAVDMWTTSVAIEGPGSPPTA